MAERIERPTMARRPKIRSRLSLVSSGFMLRSLISVGGKVGRARLFVSTFHRASRKVGMRIVVRRVKRRPYWQGLLESLALPI